MIQDGQGDEQGDMEERGKNGKQPAREQRIIYVLALHMDHRFRAGVAASELASQPLRYDQSKLIAISDTEAY
jgi:hypothetical protein